MTGQKLAGMPWMVRLQALTGRQRAPLIVAVKGVRVRDVVRDVVTEVAPEELPLLAGLAGLDDATAVQRLGGELRRPEPLGFGLGEVAALVTPVVWLAVDQAAQQIVGTWVQNRVARTGNALRRVFRRSAPPPVVIPALTREQLALVRRSVLTMAEQRGLEPERAAVIADAVVTRLVLDEPEAVAVAEVETDGPPELLAPRTPVRPNAPELPDAPVQPDESAGRDGRPEGPDEPTRLVEG
ncbi:hypothetical protein [Streptomyces xiamenensis]|uniref:hypothetical protein n=1 Tax=Streptomyces xiamenensis TaxID=408015 RepID=UPI0035D690DB